VAALNGQTVETHVSRQERSQNSKTNLKLITSKFRAGWVEGAKTMNFPEGEIKIPANSDKHALKNFQSCMASHS